MEKLINEFIDDIFLDNNKLLLVFGNGMSMKTRDNPKNGSESTSYYINKFKEYIKDSETIITPENLDNINSYSNLAKIIIEGRNGLKPISRIYKRDFLPIINAGLTEKANEFTSKKVIEENLKQRNVCKKISLNDGLESFGKVCNYLPKYTHILTSNFDPFLEIVLNKNEIDFISLSYSYNLQKRPNIRIGEDKIKIEHYHGYWLDETAHINLEDNDYNIRFFKNLIKEYDAIYVFGFGGWDDAFSLALYDIINKEHPENELKIHWTFYDEQTKVNSPNNPKLIKTILEKNLEENNNLKILKYFNINTNEFFPKLLEKIRIKKLKEELKNYSDALSNNFNKNNASFFEKVPAKFGSLWKREENLDLNSQSIPDYVLGKMNENKSIVLCSKFGMGKTTVMQNIFKAIVNKDKYPIFFNLAHFKLNNLVEDENSIAKTILKEELKIDFQNEEVDALVKIVNEMLRKGEVVLLLDSLDEAIYKIEELELFKTRIIYLSYPLITSIRLEFHDFIDNAKEFEKWNYEAIELLEWDKNTAKKFLEKLNSVEEEKKNKILSLNKLLKRPLFIDLFLRIDNFGKIDDNIASLYYQTILETLQKSFNNDDNNLKKGKIKEIWNLLNNIAISIYLEYQHYKLESDYKTIPSVIFSSDNLRLLASRNRFMDYFSIIKLLNDEINEINKLIKKIKGQNFTFFHRSLFEYLVANGAAHKIITEAKCSEAWDVYQTDEVSEYFVQEVNRENVFESEQKKNNFYKAFDNEFSLLYNALASLKEEGKLNPDSKFDFANKIANEKYFDLKDNLLILDLNKPIIEYSERLEEVLYYIGKFKEFWTEDQKTKFVNYCKFFFYNARLKYNTGKNYPGTDKPIKKAAINPIYYRTSAISLSRLENNKYIYDYLSYLFRDYISVEKEYFYTQVLKDIKYYGKEELEKKCMIAYKKVLETTIEDNLKPLEILKIFSLIISLNYQFDKNYPSKLTLILDIEKIKETEKKLKELIEHAKKNKWKKFSDMLEGLQFVFRDLSFEIRAQNEETFKWKENLEKAIENRIQNIQTRTLDNNIFRIVNSFGDNLPYLEIDYYNGQIIITTNKEFYYTNKDEIKNILLKKFNNKVNVDGIGIKHNINFHYTSKYLGETKLEELINEGLNKTIECIENNIGTKYIVKPEGYPKTGFFIDNRKIRKYIKEYSEGKDILNAFSFTCTIGAIAKKNNANYVINIDQETKYLELGKKIYKQNEISIGNEELEFKNHFINPDQEKNKLSKIVQNKKFDIIILDMPEIAPVPCNFEEVANIYKKHNEDALRLLKENGILITSCCSHGFSRNRFLNVLKELVENNSQFELIENLKLDELIDHPKKVDDNLSDYLKIYAIKKTDGEKTK